MDTATLDSVSASGATKARTGALRYLLLSVLGGVYVGFGVVLSTAVGGPLAAAGSPLLKALMGASFGIALLLVIFAGAELFTGTNMVMVVAAVRGAARVRDLSRVWVLSLIGNLGGGVLLGAMVAGSGVFSSGAPLKLVTGTAATKMALPFADAFLRGVLANWLVCLAVWMAARALSDGARVALVAWCLFAFVAAGFEHSVANMTLFSLALFVHHGAVVTLGGAVHNLVPVILGNIVGGAVFVGGAYALATPRRLVLVTGAGAPQPELIGRVAEPAVAGAGAGS